MLIFDYKDNLKTLIRSWKKAGETIGLVPTMGYLHEGHISLVKAAKKRCDRVVVSVFVNPTQFGPNEDFASYPRDFKRDCKLLEASGVDAVFHPNPENFYPEDFCAWIQTEKLTDGLCGKTRPSHFRGVCTVVGKLFHVVEPDFAFFGQKDAQQLAVIQRMVRDLDFPLTVVGCPIVRDSDGLAKSSRNKYLSDPERKAALVLSESVRLGEKLIEAGERDCKRIRQAMLDIIAKEPLAKVDYLESVDAVNMQPVVRIDKPVLFAMAVYIGKTRLLDNFVTHG